MADKAKKQPAASGEAKNGKPSHHFEIRTPSPVFTGERCGLKFRDGVAGTEDGFLAESMRQLGYAVIDLAAPAPATDPLATGK